MKRRYLLATLIIVFMLAVLCLIAGCSLFGGSGGGNDPIDSNAIRYLHFVDKDGNTLLDYQVDKNYSEKHLLETLEKVVVDYCSPSNGKYLDGTAFSSVKSELSNYFVNNDTDTFIKNRPAYTVVMEMVAITHSLDYYVDNILYKHYDLTYAQWQDIVTPSVPHKDGYFGHWSKLPTIDEFRDFRIDAVYIITYSISSAEDWNLMAEHPDAYFTLENDIDFLGGEIPVMEEFNGTLDGQGHKVTNFVNVNSQCDTTYGLFIVNNGTICNIVFSEGSYTVRSKNLSEQVNVGFLTGVNEGVIENVKIDDLTVKITCYYSTYKANLPHDVEVELSAGVLAGTNNSEIRYVTVSDSVNANIDTYLNAVRMDGYPDGKLTVWASYGAVAGSNKGRVSHATSSVGSLNSGATLLQNKSNNDESIFRFVNFYLAMGCIVGNNYNGAAFVVDSFANGKVKPDYDASLGSEKFVSTVDVGGIVGSNSGQVNKCHVGTLANLSALCSAETRIGGVVGANNGGINACYSEAQLVPGNRSYTHKTYCGGVVGLNNSTITYSYAIVNSVKLSTGTNAKNVYFGGLFGYANNQSTVSHSFVKLATAGLTNSNVFGFYESVAIDPWCYAYLTDAATGYQSCDKVTVFNTEQELLDAIKTTWNNSLGFLLSDDTYPTLPNVGNNE